MFERFYWWKIRNYSQWNLILTALRVTLFVLSILALAVVIWYYQGVYLPNEIALGNTSWCELSHTFYTYTSRCMEELAHQAFLNRSH